jgi:hypothetical protein
MPFTLFQILTKSKIISINYTTFKSLYKIHIFQYISNLLSLKMEDLALILVKLSQKILNTGESRKLKIAKLMLNSLDPDFFTDSLILEISTFS